MLKKLFKKKIDSVDIEISVMFFDSTNGKLSISFIEDEKKREEFMNISVFDPIVFRFVVGTIYRIRVELEKGDDYMGVIIFQGDGECQIAKSEGSMKMGKIGGENEIIIVNTDKYKQFE